MKNYIFTAVLLFLTISLSAQPIPKYKDASQPIEVRVQDLLSRMTIEEKVAQLRHIHEGSILNDDHTLNLEKMKNIIGTLGWGAVEGLTLEGIEMARYTYQIQSTVSKIPAWVFQSLLSLSHFMGPCRVGLLFSHKL